MRESEVIAAIDRMARAMAFLNNSITIAHEITPDARLSGDSLKVIISKGHYPNQTEITIYYPVLVDVHLYLFKKRLLACTEELAEAKQDNLKHLLRTIGY